MKIQYVGLKEDGETAFGAMTGIERWMPGDVHEVKDDFAKRMLQHPDVFARYEEAATQKGDGGQQAPVGLGVTLAPGATVPNPGTPLTGASITVEGQVIDLSGMDKDQLHDLAKRLDIAVHHASGPAKVIEALQAAFSGE